MCVSVEWIASQTGSRGGEASELRLEVAEAVGCLRPRGKRARWVGLTC